MLIYVIIVIIIIIIIIIIIMIIIIIFFFSGSTKRRTGELIMDGVEERNADHVTNHAQYVEINDIHSYELKRDDIKFERLVGSGNFGEVFKATIDNNIVAVKSLKGKIYVTLPCFCLHFTSCSLWFPDQSANTKRQIFTLRLWVFWSSLHVGKRDRCSQFRDSYALLHTKLVVYSLYNLVIRTPRKELN